MTDSEHEQEHADWQRGALWLAGAAATATLLLRLILHSDAAEAVAVGLLTGVIVFGLALVANRRR